jgi:hypothetical protein
MDKKALKLLSAMAEELGVSTYSGYPFLKPDSAYEILKGVAEAQGMECLRYIEVRFFEPMVVNNFNFLI